MASRGRERLVKASEFDGESRGRKGRRWGEGNRVYWKEVP